MSYNMPGFGDAATWRNVTAPCERDDDTPDTDDLAEALREVKDWIGTAEIALLNRNKARAKQAFDEASMILASLAGEFK